MRRRLLDVATVWILAVVLIVAGAICVPLDAPDAAEARFDHHRNRWGRLAHCESTHRWRISDGGLQIIPSTWRAYTGRHAPQRAELASRRFQIRVGKRIAWRGFGRHDPQGGRAWPYCWPRTR